MLAICSTSSPVYSQHRQEATFEKEKNEEAKRSKFKSLPLLVSESYLIVAEQFVVIVFLLFFLSFAQPIHDYHIISDILA